MCERRLTRKIPMHMSLRFTIHTQHTIADTGVAMVPYPAESHLVRGHSHMPAKSGLSMSEAKNSDSGKPGRSSQSGTHPAPGASRTRLGSSVVEPKADEVRVVVAGAKATAAVLKLERTAHFMVMVKMYI